MHVALRARNDVQPAQAVVAAFRKTADSLPAEDLRRLYLLRLSKQLEAMALFTSGQTDRAISELTELAPTDRNNASLPPRTIPTYELLGAYLLAAGRNADAAVAFERARERRPNRALGVRGLARAIAR